MKGDTVTEERKYEEAVRDHIVGLIRRERFEDAGFRLEEVTLEREYPWTRLVVYFRRDDAPGQLFGYWGPIWESVAWHELHNRPALAIRSQPARFAELKFFSMETDLSNADLPDRVDEAMDPGEPWTPEGVRWIRGRVAW